MIEDKHFQVHIGSADGFNRYCKILHCNSLYSVLKGNHHLIAGLVGNEIRVQSLRNPRSLRSDLLFFQPKKLLV